MPVFEYKGLTSAGKNVGGVIDADSARSARAKLRRDGIFPTDLSEQSAREGGGGNGKAGKSRVKSKSKASEDGTGKDKKVSLNMEVDFGRYFQRVKVADVAIVTRQLATLIGAGIPIVESLAAVADQTDNDKFRVVLAEIREKVNEGSSMADAMAGYPKIFNELYRNMVGAGEQSGTLEVVLVKLADYTEGQVELRSKVAGALIYPLIMACVAGTLVTFLMVGVVPKIAKIFEDMNATLPLLTRILIGMSSFITNYWYLVILMGTGAFFVGRWWVRTEAGRLIVDTYSLKVPVLGRLLLLVAVARFASTLSTLLSSGVPILTAMNIVRSVVDNVVIKEVLENVRESVAEGQSIATPLKRSEQFPPLVTHMVAIGERTGELEMMLSKVAESYEQQVDRTVGTLTTMLEPIMILIMGGGVGFIALSVMLPMLKLNQVVG